MERITYTTLLFCIIKCAAYSQFIDDQITHIVPNNLNGDLDYNNMSLFDPDRFDIQQGFSMSMMSLGNQSVSIAGYTNNITYWAKDNLRLNANILLYQPSISRFDNQNGLKNNPKVAFDAALIYQPTKNSFLEISIKNLPNYGINNRLNSNLLRTQIPAGYGFGIY